MDKINDYVSENTMILIFSLIVTILSVKLLKDINKILLMFVLSIILVFILYQNKFDVRKLVTMSLIIITFDNVINGDVIYSLWKIPYWTIISFYTLTLL
jgi:hypothetical protein